MKLGDVPPNVARGNAKLAGELALALDAGNARLETRSVPRMMRRDSFYILSMRHGLV
jgi:hypothetical protein